LKSVEILPWEKGSKVTLRPSENWRKSKLQEGIITITNKRAISMYSGEPNKRAAHLIILGEISLPTRAY